MYCRINRPITSMQYLLMVYSTGKRPKRELYRVIHFLIFLFNEQTTLIHNTFEILTLIGKTQTFVCCTNFEQQTNVRVLLNGVRICNVIPYEY